MVHSTGRTVRFLTCTVALTLFLQIARAVPADKYNITVHVVEVKTGKGLSHITVNLSLGNYRGRKTLQQVTDSAGTAHFCLEPPLPKGVSLDVFSVRYHQTQADAEVTSLPQEVTIQVRRLSLIQSLQFIFGGD